MRRVNVDAGVRPFTAGRARAWSRAAMAAAVLCGAAGWFVASVGGAPADVEWRAYAASNAGTKYSPLDQIDRTTVKDLRMAWRQSAVPGELVKFGAGVRTVNFENTPIMVDGVLYIGTGLGTVAALDPKTGAVKWLEGAPKPRARARPRWDPAAVAWPTGPTAASRACSPCVAAT